MRTLRQDVRFAARMLAKKRAFTAVTVAVLALGIGANTAIFSLVNAVLLKMLPVHDAQRLYFLAQPNRPKGDLFDYPFFAELRAQQNPAISGILAFSGSMPWNVRIDQEAGVATGQIVSGEYHSLLGITAAAGRLFLETDDAPSAQPVAVISHAYWKRKFAADPSIVGRKVVVNGASFTVIGVTPAEFFGLSLGENPDISIPLAMLGSAVPGTSLAAHARVGLRLVARLAEGASAKQAEASLALAAARTAEPPAAQPAPGTRQERLRGRIELTPASHGLATLQRRFAKPLLILMAVVAAVLLIACVNVAGLLLVRASERKKEIAVRLALGARRSRLIRQLLTEAAIIAAAAGGAGLAIYHWAAALLSTFVLAGRATLEVQTDWRVLAFAASISLFTALLFGLAPAINASGIQLTGALKGDSRGAGTSGVLHFPAVLVIAQVAISFVLLAGCAFFVGTLRNLRTLDPGFDTDRVLLFTVDPTLSGYKGPQVTALYRDLLQTMTAVPGVQSATVSRMRLLSGSSTTGTVSAAGEPAGPEVYINQVGPAFFETMGITMLHGRGIGWADDEKAAGVAVVNERAAKQLFGVVNAVGKRLGTTGQIEVVGIVRDARYDSLRTQPPPTVYYPLLQLPDQQRAMHFAARTHGDATAVVAAIQSRIRRLHPELLVTDVKTQAAQVNDLLIQERLLASLSAFFGMLAVLLAAIGLNGLTAYRVARRTKEIGVRIALGAEGHNILTLVLGESLRLVALGIVIGVPIALAATRVISASLFGLTPADPLPITVAAAVVIAAAAFAAYIPARRATRVDPMVALRYE